MPRFAWHRSPNHPRVDFFEHLDRVLLGALADERPRLECAAALGVEVGNFDVILFRALRAFRKEYGEPE